MPININKFTKNITMVITVNVTKEFRLRIFIAKQLMILAAYILGCGFEMEVENEKKSKEEKNDS